MMKRLVWIMLAVVLIALVGCTAGPNGMVDTPDEEGEVAGFWAGLWHGVIAPITLVISLFKDNVSMYAIHNNGGWYDAGFLFGLAVVWGGGGRGSKRARKSK